MNRLPLLALLLAACSSIEGPWEGTCGSNIGDMSILTGDMGAAGVAEGWSGDHTRYTATEVILEFPDGGQPDVSVDMVVCEDKDGCLNANDSYDKNGVIVTIYDVNDLALVTGTGTIKKDKKITGTCVTNFPGSGEFLLERTNKGPGD